MEIAILMSTYNGHNFLDEQLESLYGQTLKDNMSIYIRDDGSSDDTLNIIKKWKPKMNIFLYKEQNVGPAKSFWNLLLKPEIHADYYAFCDQDDVWDPDKLEAAIHRLKNDVCLYACNSRIIDERGKVTNENRLKKKPVINIERLFIAGCTQGCSMVFTEALRKYLLTRNITCVPMHDVIVMLYALKYGTIKWDSETHFGYRVHSNNVVAKNNKSPIANLKTIYWNWKNSEQNSMAIVAKEMYMNIENLSEREKDFLARIAEYKKHKISTLMKSNYYDVGHSSIRSYKARILLGLY